MTLRRILVLNTGSLNLRYVFRRMFRSPGFTSMVVVTIALGIGVNLGIFTITKALFLNVLGVPDADRMVYYTLGANRDTGIRFPIQGYEALRRLSTASDILAWQPKILELRESSENSGLNSALVTGNTFSVLGIRPFLGRFFNEADDVEGGGKDGWTAVLGYSYWKSHWAGDPHVIGKTINLSGASVQIVGVLPPEFSGVEPFKKIDILVPHTFEMVTDPHSWPPRPGAIALAWFVLGRLPAGISISQVQANLKTIEPSFLQTGFPGALKKVFFPNTEPGSLLGVHDGRMGVTPYRTLRDPLSMLQGLAGAALLFCCCNLILLFFSRAQRGAHATAIRLVLGARPGDQARLAAVEAAVLAGFGCLAAVPVAWITADLLSVAIRSTPGFDRFPAIGANYFLISIAAGITLAAGGLTASGTSLWMGAKRASISLREGNHAIAPRSRNWIIGFEVVVSVAMATAAITSVVGFQTLSSRSGFDGEAVMAKFMGGFFNPELDRILNQVRSSPGVQAVATADFLPLSNLGSAIETATAYSSKGSVRQLDVWPENVSIAYFSAIGTKILRGRDFQPGDLGQPVCILSNNAASILFPGEDPIGKYINEPGCRIIGTAEDTHFRSMSEPPDAVMYSLVRQSLPRIIVKAATSGLAMQALRNAGKDELSSIAPIGVYVDRDLRLWKVITIAGTLCALLAGVILAVGFFGIMSLQVAERQREIGIRIALGSSLARVSLTLLTKLGPAMAAGLALGSAGAWLAAVKIAELYHLNFQAAIACYLGSVALLVLLMLGAVAVPLRRAFAISPVECLSVE